MKHKISDELREFYRRWLEAKACGDAARFYYKGAYQMCPSDKNTDVNEAPTCDILRWATAYRFETHLLKEHQRLLVEEFQTHSKPFGTWDDCAKNPLRVAFITKYAE